MEVVGSLQCVGRMGRVELGLSCASADNFVLDGGTDSVQTRSEE